MDNERETSWGDIFFRGCIVLIALPFVLALSFCGWAKWSEPRNALPREVEWDEVIAFGNSYGLREGCGFGVYHISALTAARFAAGRDLPYGWFPTPLHMEDDQYAYVGPDRQRITLYAHHATTCASDKAKSLKLTEKYERALHSPGHWYKVFSHGEGLMVVAPDEGLAWYMYNG